MLYYAPLEPYISRYTAQWSAPETGWLERNWRKAGIEYQRIEPAHIQPRQVIKTGSVVDGIGRTVHSFNQVKEILHLAEQGKIKDSDVIYLDDFFHPGLEALAYNFHLLGIRPRVYAFLHAQSVDIYDFTHPMRSWMRHWERMAGEFLDGIFVCCPTLKDLVVVGGIAPGSKVHVTGHPFNSEEVMERMPRWYRQANDWDPDRCTDVGLVPPERQNKVVWSSRWDAEKNPEFFLEVAKAVKSVRPDTDFVVCSSAPEIRSNDSRLLGALKRAQEDGTVIVKQGLSKEQYYAELCEAKVQFNCASQDFVAITLLEASVAGCYPVYPHFRSFPETFLDQPWYMYCHLDLVSARDKIISVLDRDDLWTPEGIKSRAWIHSRFDHSWKRMLAHMGMWSAGYSGPRLTYVFNDKDHYRKPVPSLGEPFILPDPFDPKQLEAR